ncbi:hypothetical protein N9N67_10695, partial [Bacteriovoracaceae bacterium]|nr:hypothetical protein [Bacteriovoracaceae bacterium]
FALVLILGVFNLVSAQSESSVEAVAKKLSCPVINGDFTNCKVTSFKESSEKTELSEEELEAEIEANIVEYGGIEKVREAIYTQMKAQNEEITFEQVTAELARDILKQSILAISSSGGEEKKALINQIVDSGLFTSKFTTTTDGSNIFYSDDYYNIGESRNYTVGDTQSGFTSSCENNSWIAVEDANGTVATHSINADGNLVVHVLTAALGFDADFTYACEDISKK